MKALTALSVFYGSHLVGTPDEPATTSPGSPDHEDQGAGSGCVPDVGFALRRQAQPMSRYLLEHRHEPQECGVVFASFKGDASPLRHRATLASCRSGGHAIWWTVEAETEDDALKLLPAYVAKRTTVARVSEVDIP